MIHLLVDPGDVSRESHQNSLKNRLRLVNPLVISIAAVCVDPGRVSGRGHTV